MGNKKFGAMAAPLFRDGFYSLLGEIVSGPASSSAGSGSAAGVGSAAPNTPAAAPAGTGLPGSFETNKMLSSLFGFDPAGAASGDPINRGAILAGQEAFQNRERPERKDTSKKYSGSAGGGSQGGLFKRMN